MSACAASVSSVRWAFNFGTWHPTESQFLLASSCVQEEEKARIGKFVFRADAKASLAGRLLMRKYVSSACGIPYSDVKFLRDEMGKPYVLNSHAQVNFNVSHHGDLVVLAGEAANRKVGVDVMKLEYKTEPDMEDFFRVMSRQFTPQEWGNVRGPAGTPTSKQMVMFYRHWCLKESYLKAIGTGISVDLNRVNIVIQEQDLCVGSVVRDTRMFFDREPLMSWCFEETLLDDHCVAVAVESNSDKVEADSGQASPGTFQFLDFDHLMAESNPLLPPDIKYVQDFFGKSEKRLTA